MIFFGTAESSLGTMPNSKDGGKEDVRNVRLRRRKIGEQLRAIYDEVASEPVPDEFLRLLEEADRNTTNPDETSS